MTPTAFTSTTAPKVPRSLGIMCFISIAICYADRVIISVAIVPMSEQFNWTADVQGAILSSFFVGYLLTQIIGGYLADKIGGEKILLVAVIIWSVFTVLTPAGALISVAALIAIRIAMGLGEGMAFPSIYSIYGRRMPEAKRARAITFAVSGIPVGTVLTLLLSPFLIASIGWAASFYLFGALGLIWSFFWWAREPTAFKAREKDGSDSADQSDHAPSPSLLTLIKNRAVIAIVVAHFCVNWTSYVLLAWLPTYVSKGLGVDFAVVGAFAMMPALASIIGLNAAGWIADKLRESGMSLTRVRKTMTAIGVGASATSLLMVGFIGNAYGAIAIMTIGAAIGSVAMAGFGVNHLDIAPNHAGTLMGLSNTAGTLPGIFGVYLTGVLLETYGSWMLVFGTAGLVGLFGLVIFLLFASSERQF